MKVLAEGAGFVAVDKPAGALVIPGRGAAPTAPTVKAALEEVLHRRLWVVHRLDRDTSGVLLFALNEAAHRTLSMAFERGQIEKRYLALAAGDVSGPLELTFPLAPARRGRMRVAAPGEGKPAHTRVRPVERFQAQTLVCCEPLTGRQHQIRVHLAAAGHPLWVDPQYGRPADALFSRTPLHAEELTLPSGEQIAAPLPEDFARALQTLQRSKNRAPRNA